MIDAVAAGGDIYLTQNITLTQGISVANNNQVNIDLNGYTVDGYITTGNSRLFTVTEGTLTVENGIVNALSNETHDEGSFGAFRVQGDNASLYLANIVTSNARKNGLNVKVVQGYARLENVTINSVMGGGIEVSGSLPEDGSTNYNGMADVINCNFTQTGYYDWCSTTFSVSGAGTINVNGGEFVSENYVAYVFSSGGNMNIDGGAKMVKTSTANVPEAIRADWDEKSYAASSGINITIGDCYLEECVAVNFTGNTVLNVNSDEGMRVLAEALKSFPEGKTLTVNLMKDVTVSSDYAISNADKLIINGNGFNINGVDATVFNGATIDGVANFN